MVGAEDGGRVGVRVVLGPAACLLGGRAEAWQGACLLVRMAGLCLPCPIACPALPAHSWAARPAAPQTRPHHSPAPPLPLPLLLQVLSVEEEEFCAIPMGGCLPARPQRVVGVGGTAGMVHPSTGYMVARVLGAAPMVADAIVDQLSSGGLGG